jgi:hypothetical protein
MATKFKFLSRISEVTSLVQNPWSEPVFHWCNHSGMKWFVPGVNRGSGLRKFEPPSARNPLQSLEEVYVIVLVPLLTLSRRLFASKL